MSIGVIHLNGPINSGKTSVGRTLAQRLTGADFLDGDDHDAPGDAPLPDRIAAAWRRIETHIASAQNPWLVIAYPLDDAGFARLRAACDRRAARLLVVTLAPPEAVALTDRGGRVLTAWERQRVTEMYRDGYPARAFSDVVLDTAGLTPGESADRLMKSLPAG